MGGEPKGVTLEIPPHRGRREALPVGLSAAFPALAADGLGVIDVGARGGIHHPMFVEMAPILNVVGFEPDPEECRRLQAAARQGSGFKSLAYLPCALGKADGQRALHLGRLRGTSSFYQPNRAFLDRFPDASRYDVVGTVSVPVRSLDSLAADPAGPLPRHIDFIKLDTQGAELDILHGARRTLQTQIVGVEAEVGFARLYAQQPIFRDVDALLVGCGFTLFKLRRHEWVRRTYEDRPHLSAGQMVFAEALYLRDPSDPASSWRPSDAHAAEALILAALLYDLHDFSREVVTGFEASGLLEVEALRGYLAQRDRRLHRSWSRSQVFVDLLRVLRTPEHWMSPFKRYPRRWARGDDDFYSRT